MRSASGTTQVVVHTSRQQAELLTLLGNPRGLGVDPGGLSVDSRGESIDPPVEPRSQRIDAGAKVEESSQLRCSQDADGGPGNHFHSGNDCSTCL